jgi:hypothetical protein
MRRALLLSILLLLVGGCTKIDYVGEEYPPTLHVDLYYSEADIEQDYRVMGHTVASASDIVSAEKMQKKIVEKAKEKGADGVVILGLDRYVSGESTTYRETTDTKEKKGKTETTTTATSTTSTQEKKEIRALFIKYR